MTVYGSHLLIGKRQALGLGKELRKFVGPFVSESYNRTEAKYYSSSANRCQMTLQRPVALADWYPLSAAVVESCSLHHRRSYAENVCSERVHKQR
ncbi:hypothetical protein COOONC_02626 [Cooperia oncophora]